MVRNAPPDCSYHASRLKQALAKRGEDVDLFQVNIAQLAVMPSLKPRGIFGGLSGWHFGYIKGGFDLESDQVLLVIPSIGSGMKILHKDDYYAMWLDPAKLRVCGSDAFVEDCSIKLANATMEAKAGGFIGYGDGMDRVYYAKLYFWRA